MFTFTAANNRRVKQELIGLGILLAIGLVLLPGLIYLTGMAIFGPYAEQDGVLHFYAQIYGDLLQGSLAGWFIVLGPFLFVQLIRACWRIFRGPRPVATNSPPPPSDTRS